MTTEIMSDTLAAELAAAWDRVAGSPTEHPPLEPGEFTVRDYATRFGLTPHKALWRLTRLRKRGLVTCEEKHVPGHRQMMNVYRLVKE